MEHLEDKMVDGIDTLTSKRIRDKISEKYYQMNVQSESNNSGEHEKSCCVKT